MEDRVLLHEPSQALFVPDNDPLLFYRAIAVYARKALSPGGGLFFEINSRFPSEMKALLESEGFADIDIARDYLGNFRYAIATQPLP
jgi:release factor glutamine methyltransferase